MIARLVAAPFDDVISVARGSNSYYTPAIHFPQDDTLVIYSLGKNSWPYHVVRTKIADELTFVRDLDILVTQLPHQIWRAAQATLRGLDSTSDRDVLLGAQKLLQPAVLRIEAMERQRTAK